MKLKENFLKCIKFNGSKIIIHVILAIVILGSISGTLEAANPRLADAAASDAMVHHIINGSWYLHPGNSTDTPYFSGPISDLMAQGTEFDVLCVTSGPPITPDGNLAIDGSSDSAWEYGTDAATGDMGFVSDQGLDTQVTPGSEIAQLESQGIASCGSSNSGSTSAQMTPVTAVFFSVRNDNNVTALPGGKALNTPAVSVIPLSQWAPGSCSDMAVGNYVPATVTTLAGWSIGRLGPIYFLTANPNRWVQIHTIILFDPGNTENFTGADACDTNPQYDINSTLASWLSSDPTNRLIIFTGAVTEEGPAIGPDTQTPIAEQMQNGSLETPRFSFSGLWTYYLAGIWNQPFANQAQICDYNGMQHEDVLKNFSYTVLNPPSSCPVSSDGQQPVAWNP